MSKNLRYKKLELELRPYIKAMAAAADTIITQDVSLYPIMVAHQHEIELGIPIVTKESYPEGNWNIHASSLEEFVTKNLIADEKVGNFRATYKEASDFVCIFTLSELGAEFVFLPITPQTPPSEKSKLI